MEASFKWKIDCNVYYLLLCYLIPLKQSIQRFQKWAIIDNVIVNELTIAWSRESRTRCLSTLEFPGPISDLIKLDSIGFKISGYLIGYWSVCTRPHCLLRLCLLTLMRYSNACWGYLEELNRQEPGSGSILIRIYVSLYSLNTYSTHEKW